MNLNKIFVLGNLTRDPEVRSLPSGGTVASFAVATNRVWNDKNGQKQQDTQFHNIVVFGKMAETCAKYLNKGKMVLVEGRIQNRSWDAPDGTKKYRTEVVAEGIQLGPRTASETSGASFTSNRPNNPPVANKPQAQNQKATSQDAGEPRQGREENIPIIEQDAEEVDISDIPF